jgi:hypothetical protein
VASLFVVDDPHELNALLRALFAAKFHAHDDGPELAGSPILARLCERAMAGFVAAQESGRLPGSAEQTRAAWAMPPGAEVVASVRRHLATEASRGNWSRWSPAERAEYVRLVFRPYVAAEPLVQELVGSAPDAEPSAAADPARDIGSGGS